MIKKESNVVHIRNLAEWMMRWLVKKELSTELPDGVLLMHLMTYEHMMASYTEVQWDHAIGGILAKKSPLENVLLENKGRMDIREELRQALWDCMRWRLGMFDNAEDATDEESYDPHGHTEEVQMDGDRTESPDEDQQHDEQADDEGETSASPCEEEEEGAAEPPKPKQEEEPEEEDQPMKKTKMDDVLLTIASVMSEVSNNTKALRDLAMNYESQNMVMNNMQNQIDKLNVAQTDDNMWKKIQNEIKMLKNHMEENQQNKKDNMMKKQLALEDVGFMKADKPAHEGTVVQHQQEHQQEQPRLEDGRA